MIPYDIDPSLHGHAPERELLDDGFSPPAAQPAPEEPAPATALLEKSEF